MSSDDFIATHRIEVKHIGGKVETIDVRVVDATGDCYTAEEWRWHYDADWRFDARNRLTFQGEPSPSDRAYRISKITEAQHA